MRPFRLFFLLPGLWLLTACHVFQSSELQRTVRETAKANGNSKTSALDRVSQLLTQRKIAHKVVQFRYEVAPRPLIPSLGFAGVPVYITPLTSQPSRRTQMERSGIVYRDEADPRHPWWYVDEKKRRPTWLPNDSTEQQVRFAAGRSAVVLRVQEFDPNLREAVTNPASDHWEARFLQMHGTEFDPASALDRSKMSVLQNG